MHGFVLDRPVCIYIYWLFMSIYMMSLSPLYYTMMIYRSSLCCICALTRVHVQGIWITPRSTQADMLSVCDDEPPYTCTQALSSISTQGMAAALYACTAAVREQCAWTVFVLHGNGAGGEGEVKGQCVVTLLMRHGGGSLTSLTRRNADIYHPTVLVHIHTHTHTLRTHCHTQSDTDTLRHKHTHS